MAREAGDPRRPHVVWLLIFWVCLKPVFCPQTFLLA